MEWHVTKHHVIYIVVDIQTDYGRVTLCQYAICAEDVSVIMVMYIGYQICTQIPWKPKSRGQKQFVDVLFAK